MKKLRIHYLQHVPFEGLGYIETWATDRGHVLSSTRFFEDEHLPSLSDFDMLVVMGGPMGVYDENLYSWLSKEKLFVKDCIRNGKLVFGVCLGAQLIAECLGAKVYPNVKKEIGWFPVFIEKASKTIDFDFPFPEKFNVLHWHGDTFDLPKGANLLLWSEACKNQCFRFGSNVFGFQFHLEATPDTLHEMIKNCGHELAKDEFVQNAEEILAKEECKKVNMLLEKFLNDLEKFC